MSRADSGPSDSRDAAKPLPWPKRILFSVVALSLSMAFAAVLGEMLVRVVAPQQLIMLRPDIWAPVDTLGWRQAPNLNTEVNTGERTVALMTDSEGFRVGRAGRSTGGDSILIVGDSFMAALQVEYEQSLAGLIEGSMSGPGGTPLAVRNTGVGAWGPWHYSLLTRRRLAEHSYALVLVAVYVGNDIVEREVNYFPPSEVVERLRFRIPLNLSVDDWVDGVARPINDLLETNSHLFMFLKNRSEPLRIRLGLSPLQIPEGLLRDRADGGEWAVTATILEEVFEYADDRGVPTLFVLIPARYQVDEELFIGHAAAFGMDTASIDLDQPNRIMAEELESRGLTVVDALPHFRAAQQQGRELYGSIDHHLAPTGHRLLYELLREPIRESLGLVTPPS